MATIKLDILAIGIHPDDVELGCGGTLAKHQALGYKTGILDLTQGEMGTRGTIETRNHEATEAAKIIKTSIRENLCLEDVWAVADKETQLAIIVMIRKYQPEIVLINAPTDRHPDHKKGANMAADACFISGLQKVLTEENGKAQNAWRPKAVYHYIQGNFINPDFVVDISDFFEIKMQAVQAYKTQFYDPTSTENDTFISDPQFLESVKSRDIMLGKIINVGYAEGFLKTRYIGVNDITKLL